MEEQEQAPYLESGACSHTNDKLRSYDGQLMQAIYPSHELQVDRIQVLGCYFYKMRVPLHRLLLLDDQNLTSS